MEELQQSVSVAIAYFEDTLQSPPRQLLSCGIGGPDELIRLLDDDRIPVRDLVPMPYSATMPRGILGGVVGALAN
jgi:type IV pilus assembly protein PilM